LKEIVVPTNKLTSFSIYTTLVLVLCLISPFYFIHGGELLKSNLYNFFLSWFTVLAVFIGIVFHEIIHLLVFIFSTQVKLKNLKVGINKEMMSPYVHVKIPITTNVYRFSALAPTILLGVFPIIWSFYAANAWFLVFGIIFFVGGSADLYIFWKLKNYDSSTKILDHEEKPGCFIV